MLYEAPAPLRHVAGFPGLRLLRELRPRVWPSPDSEGLADVLRIGDRTRVPAFRLITHGPCRWLVLPLGAQAVGHDECPAAASTSRCLQTDKVSRSRSVTKPRAVPLLGSLSLLSTGASDTSFVSSP